MTCQCRCHTSGGSFIACNVDNGFGENGMIYCGPGCNLESDYESDEACVMPHTDPAARFVGQLCRRHYNRIGQVLTQITELSALQPWYNPVTGSGQMGGTVIHSPAPGNLYTMSLNDRRATWKAAAEHSYAHESDEIPDVAETLYGWARMVEDEAPTAKPLRGVFISSPNGRSSTRVLPITTLAIYLHHHRHWISQQSWIEDYALDLDALHRALARGAGDSMWPKPIGLCATIGCEAKLYVTVGLDQVSCRRCKRVYEGADLVRLRVINDEGTGRAATNAE